MAARKPALAGIEANCLLTLPGGADATRLVSPAGDTLDSATGGVIWRIRRCDRPRSPYASTSIR